MFCLVVSTCNEYQAEVRCRTFQRSSIYIRRLAGVRWALPSYEFMNCSTTGTQYPVGRNKLVTTCLIRRSRYQYWSCRSSSDYGPPYKYLVPYRQVQWERSNVFSYHKIVVQILVLHCSQQLCRILYCKYRQSTNSLYHVMQTQSTSGLSKLLSSGVPGTSTGSQS